MGPEKENSLVSETFFVVPRNNGGAEHLLVPGLSLLTQNFIGSEWLQRWRPELGNWPASGMRTLTGWRRHTYLHNDNSGGGRMGEEKTMDQSSL